MIVKIGLVVAGHDDIVKWKHFLRYWSFVRGIPRSSVNSPHKGQWHGAMMFSLICIWINIWINNCEAGDTVAPIMTSLWWVMSHGHHDIWITSHSNVWSTACLTSYNRKHQSSALLAFRPDVRGILWWPVVSPQRASNVESHVITLSCVT